MKVIIHTPLPNLPKIALPNIPPPHLSSIHWSSWYILKRPRREDLFPIKRRCNPTAFEMMLRTYCDRPFSRTSKEGVLVWKTLLLKTGPRKPGARARSGQRLLEAIKDRIWKRESRDYWFLAIYLNARTWSWNGVNGIFARLLVPAHWDFGTVTHPRRASRRCGYLKITVNTWLH